MKKIMLAGATALSLMFTVSGTASAQVPVIDSGVIAAAVQTAANTAEQLKRLNDIMQTTQDILSAIGSNGQGQYDLNKNSSWGDFAGGGDLLKNLTQFAPNTSAFEGSSGGSARSSGSQDFSDMASARTFVEQALYSSKKKTTRVEELDYAQMRRNVMRDANVDAYALALMSRQHLADASERASKLDGIVNGAQDMRADVRANTAVALAQHQELSGMLAVMTAMLEQEAAQYFATEERDIYSKGGGSQVPDVYKDQEFLPDGTRVGTQGSGSSPSGLDELGAE